MNDPAAPLDSILRALQERAKELNCLYQVDEILKDADRPLAQQLRAVVAALPPGWQYPALCQARVVVRDTDVRTEGYRETPWIQSAPIVLRAETVGSVSISYVQAMPAADEGPFLKEERKLIDTIAERLAQSLLHRELAPVFGGPKGAAEARGPRGFRVVLDLLKRTDQTLFRQLSRKMLNHLTVKGVEEAREIRLARAPGPDRETADHENRPSPRRAERDLDAAAERIFDIAARRLSEEELLSCIQVWVKDERVHFLLQALESGDTSLPDIASALERYHHTGLDARELSTATQVGLKVALIRRLLTDHLEYVNTCRNYVEIEDFFDLASHTVLLPKSHGRLGGKASGLFVARQILKRAKDVPEMLRSVRVPKTWYLPSDGILQFVAYNNLDDVYDWRYLDVDQIRQEYPHLLQVFKNCGFPPEAVQGLGSALDDFGDRPLIVRSSSLLEDRVGSAFSGKYKSLFLANQGAKPQRLAALLDAVAEVYASVFSPDPIQYRAERGLLAHHEEMGIMIQEVVGVRCGRFFLPAFSGVALSNNELRWSPRIRRDDGLLRLVPGLGTRAVDRLTDEYPILVAPGQPGLRVNVTPEEVYRYSPRKIDVINLETNSFETIDRQSFLEEVGDELPALPQLVSLFDGQRIRPLGALDPGFSPAAAAFTFDGLLRTTPFVAQVRALMSLLRDTLGYPVDVEFASDGSDLFLLQCRPQGYAPTEAPAPIPRDIPRNQILFSANRYVSNGTVPDVTHVVYVDPDGYGGLSSLTDLRDVGRAVGSLNKTLPKRRFILMGPGRWGSRGDIKLGVNVTYADISNSAVLVEIARKRAGYVPDLSFGTHFFQDLVESSIRYLPLYPDDPGVVFDEAFLRQAGNLLPRLLPEFAHLENVVRVIDVPGSTGGQVLRILMNADLDEAVGLLAPPRDPATSPAAGGSTPR